MAKNANRGEKEHLEELKEMVQDRETEPTEKVLAVFCQRHGVSMKQCKAYYDQLIAEGAIKEK